MIAFSAHRNRWRTTLWQAIWLVVLSVGAISMMLPMIWMLSASLMPLSEVVKTPPVWFAPAKYTLNNYVEVWGRYGFQRYFLNSSLITVIITVAQLITSSMAGFAFARYDFPGRNVIFILILAALMIPFQVLMIPLFILMVRLQLVNTYWGVTLPALVTPFGIFLMRQYILSIPKALLEAARIDGASEPFIFTRIVLPLCKPAIAALAILAFLASWDNYLWPLIVINSQALWVLPIAMSRFTEQYITLTHLQMAGASIMFLPALVVFLLMQRNFIQGIALTGLKG